MMKLKVSMIVLALSTPVHAAPIYVSEHEGVKIVLHDDACKLEAVTNLPRRATWTEKGVTHEGCFGVIGPVVAAYFSGDRTVAVIPTQMFVKVSGT